MADHLFGKSSGHVGELGRIERFDYPRLSERAAGDLVVSRKACRMALRRLCAFRASASNENDYRFICFPGEINEFSSIHK